MTEKEFLDKKKQLESRFVINERKRELKQMKRAHRESIRPPTKDKPYAQKIIPLIIFMAVAYAVADYYLQVKYYIEISSTLTTAWYTFWGVEFINLALIKFGKVKHLRQGSDYGYLDTSGISEEDLETGNEKRQPEPGERS
jgi:hypothetical protein